MAAPRGPRWTPEGSSCHHAYGRQGQPRGKPRRVRSFPPGSYGTYSSLVTLGRSPVPVQGAHEDCNSNKRSDILTARTRAPMNHGNLRAFRLLLVTQAASVIVGCGGHSVTLPPTAKYVASVVMGSDRVVVNPPIVRPTAGTASTTRDLSSNALTVFTSPASRHRAMTSVDPVSRSITMEFRRESPFPAENPEVFLPLNGAGDVVIKSTRIYNDRHTLAISFQCSDLDLDMIAASLTGPSGVRGVVTFASEPFATPLVASAFAPGYEMLRAYQIPGASTRDFYVCNVTELPILIVGINYAGKSLLMGSKSATTFISSWSCKRFSVPSSPTTLDLAALSVNAKFIANSPMSFRNYEKQQ